MGDEKKKETEFSALITTDKAVAEEALKAEQDKGHKARIEKRDGGELHVIVEIDQPKK